jgi:hypothetical protein
MHTLQETKETVIMNILLNNKDTTIEELKNGLIFAGVIQPTDESLTNSIRASILSLSNRFNKYKIKFVTLSPHIHQTKFNVSEDALNFSKYNLLERMYDEEGKECGFIYQHPISLNKERLELV